MVRAKISHATHPLQHDRVHRVLHIRHMLLSQERRLERDVCPALNDGTNGPAADGAALVAPLELVCTHLAAASVAARSEARTAHLTHADDAETCLLACILHERSHGWHRQPELLAERAALVRLEEAEHALRPLVRATVLVPPATRGGDVVDDWVGEHEAVISVPYAL